MAIQAKTTGVFVTGTDTGVGKTLVACALLARYVSEGLRAVGMKPVAAGCERTSRGLVNGDVAALAAHSNVEAPENLVNPYRFEAAVAPHIAAEWAGEAISIETLVQAYSTLQSLSDRVVVEGAGGFLVPLNRAQDFSHLAGSLGLPVVLVVGVRLGCLNHALLTAEAIRSRGLRFAGWVANILDPAMIGLGQNLEALQERLQAPRLGVVPFGVTDPRSAALILEMPSILPAGA